MRLDLSWDRMDYAKGHGRSRLLAPWSEQGASSVLPPFIVRYVTDRTSQEIVYIALFIVVNTGSLLVCLDKPGH
jgi:hypothetical protein